MSEPVSPLRAWTVRARDEAVVVCAPTRGQARAAGAAELDREFVGVRIERAPEFDGLTHITTADYLARGWRVACETCGQMLGADDGPEVVGDNAYCAGGCHE